MQLPNGPWTHQPWHNTWHSHWFSTDLATTYVSTPSCKHFPKCSIFCDTSGLHIHHTTPRWYYDNLDSYTGYTVYSIQKLEWCVAAPGHINSIDFDGLEECFHLLGWWMDDSLGLSLNSNVISACHTLEYTCLPGAEIVPKSYWNWRVFSACKKISIFLFGVFPKGGWSAFEFSECSSTHSVTPSVAQPQSQRILLPSHVIFEHAFKLDDRNP